jgi:hypothetical protein
VDFPAAYACGGRVPIDSVVTIGINQLNFPAPEWENLMTISYDSYYDSKATKLPNIFQLAAIDMIGTAITVPINGKNAQSAVNIGGYWFYSGTIANNLSTSYIGILTSYNSGLYGPQLPTDNYNILCLK